MVEYEKFEDLQEGEKKMVRDHFAGRSPRSPGGYAARSAGQIDYEADVAKCPTYHDGAPRKQWHELSDVAQWSWERRAK